MFGRQCQLDYAHVVSVAQVTSCVTVKTRVQPAAPPVSLLKGKLIAMKVGGRSTLCLVVIVNRIMHMW